MPIFHCCSLTGARQNRFWGEHAARWEVPPHRLYANREICVTGTIHMHREKPRIVVSDPVSIRFGNR